MHLITLREGLEDFEQFCRSFDVKNVIAEIDRQKNTEKYAKHIYALAILRALQNHDFGYDRQIDQAAIADFWEYGHLKGFNPDTFNEVFQEYVNRW